MQARTDKFGNTTCPSCPGQGRCPQGKLLYTEASWRWDALPGHCLSYLHHIREVNYLVVDS